MRGFSKFLCLTCTDWINVFSLTLPVCIWELKSKRHCAWDKSRPRTEACWTTCTSPSGLVTAKICMTSHSAEDKAHWFFLPDREVGGGCQSNARRERERERERNVDLQMDFAAAMCECVYVCLCRNLPFVRQLVNYTCMCAVWLMYIVWVHTRVPNEYVNAIMPCLSGQWELLLCSWA